MSTITLPRPATGTPVAHGAEPFDLPAGQKALIRWHIYIGFTALAFGVMHGLAQALSYANIDILNWFVGLKNYYQGLTIHGVFNAMVFTFAFTNGFLSLATARGLGRPLHGGLLHAAFWTLVLGVLAVAYPMFSGTASVLYTFYAPLQAHWVFYLGLALLVISTWLTSVNLFVCVARWKKDHPGERIPLMAYASIATYIMWDMASIGVAVEVVGFLIPWSLGWIDGIDPLVTRTLFWFSGHPIVYFWLLPAYVSWYTMIPKQAGGVLHSDTITRLVFALFIVLSAPVGFHHQYTDPGIPTWMKTIHAVMTLAVFFPSMITAFSVVSSLETAGRRRGGGRLIGWFFKLPWGEPSFAAQLLAMLTFVLGGVTGLINASYTVNLVVHNTTWVPGHFHLTVGTAVALTFMGIAYWAVPWLKGRALWGKKLAVFQSWLYVIGALVFARGMVSGGLEGLPRRTFRAGASYTKEAWDLAGVWTGVGGTLMFLGAMLFFFILIMTIVKGKKGETPEIPVAETPLPAPKTGPETRLDRLGVVLAIAVITVLLAYVPFFVQYLPPELSSPGFRLF